MTKAKTVEFRSRPRSSSFVLCHYDNLKLKWVAYIHKKKMPRGAHLRLRNAAIKQVLANDACGAIFRGAYNYVRAPRARLTAEVKAANAAARKTTRAAARAAPEAVAARREKARVARLALKARKAAAIAAAAAAAASAAAARPARRTRAATPSGSTARPRLSAAARAALADIVEIRQAGPTTRSRASRGSGLIGGRLMSLY